MVNILAFIVKPYGSNQRYPGSMSESGEAEHEVLGQMSEAQECTTTAIDCSSCNFTTFLFMHFRLYYYII